MNRLKFSIFSIFLVLIFLVSGCTKASNATLSECYALYDQTVVKYSAVFDEDRHIDLYSADAYTVAGLYDTIIQTEEDGSLNILNMLSENGEYQTLMHGVSKIFLEWRIDNPQGEVEQKYISNFYEAIDGLDKIVEDVKFSKSAFQNTYRFVDGNVNSNALVSSLKEYLKNYCELINKYFKISVAYEKIHEQILGGDPTKEVSVVNDTDIKKLVLSFEIYLAKYFYLKDIVLTNSYISRFGQEKIYVNNVSADNSSFDELFADYMQIIAKDSNIGGISGDNLDAIFYYNGGLKKLQRFRSDIANYEKAVYEVLNNRDDSGVYQQFITDFDIEAKNSIRYILDKFIV